MNNSISKVSGFPARDSANTRAAVLSEATAWGAHQGFKASACADAIYPAGDIGPQAMLPSDRGESLLTVVCSQGNS